MYHSGVEIGGVEYTFSEAGIGQHPPRRVAAEGCAYKTTEVLGNFIGSLPEVRRILNEMREGAFAEGAYDVVRKNCNNFCDEFVFALVGKRIPSWVNRAATLGTWAGLGERKGSAAAGSRQGAAAATGRLQSTASAAPSRDRKELTQKQRELLTKMRTSRSSVGERGGVGRGGGTA
eukprot:jgi/Undpi1/6313/HiC_scaffold_20.g08796.m1